MRPIGIHTKGDIQKGEIRKTVDRRAYKEMVAALDKLSQDNKWLVELICRHREARNEGWYIFGFKEAIAFATAAYSCPGLLAAQSEEDLTRDASLFWDIIDWSRKQPLKENDNWHRGVMATLIVYRSIINAKMETEAFRTDIRSPYERLRRLDFLWFLDRTYTKREDFFSFYYDCVSIKEHRRNMPYNPLVLFLPFRSGFLRDAAVGTLRETNHYLPKTTCQQILSEVESWFEGKGTIRSLDDVTVARLDYAVKKIKERHTKKDERKIRLRLLFELWKHFMQMDPDRDFFGDSPFWRAECIMDFTTPAYVADDYVIVPAGRMRNKLLPYDKILFTLTHNDTLTASGIRFYQKAVKFTDILEMGWKIALVNYSDYCIANGSQKYLSARIFAKWMIENGTRYDDKKILISRKDVNEFRAYLLFGTMRTSSAKQAFDAVLRFAKWGSSAGFFSVDERAFWTPAPINSKDGNEPKAVSRAELAQLKEALDKLYSDTGEIRFLYARILLCIQCNSSARPGEITSMRVSQISFKEDGTCTVTTRGKNNGDEFIHRFYNEIATGYIREALDASRQTRTTCPKCTYKDNVFLYYSENNKNGRGNGTKGYHCMNVALYNYTLDKATSQFNLEKCNSYGIRRRYITELKRMGRQENLSNETVMVLTGHARMATVNGYDNIELDDILDASEAIDLGTPSMK